MLHDTLYGLHLVDRCGLGSLLEAEEVADEDRTLLLIDELRPSLKFIVIPLTGSQLQLGDGLWVPGMFDAVLTPGKLPLVLQ